MLLRMRQRPFPPHLTVYVIAWALLDSYLNLDFMQRAQWQGVDVDDILSYLLLRNMKPG